MIEKIISIKNVGRFENYSATGDTTFKRLTLIYSENARGKTTLSAIFRSLCTGSPTYILERHTLGITEDVLVQLRVEGNSITFTNDMWNQTIPNIKIFDDTFIEDNVYSGCTVEHEHKKNLYRFAIGEEGVHLAEEVEDLDEKIRNINSLIRSNQDEIRKQMIGSIEVDDFVALGQIDDIDKVIQTKKKEIEALKRAEQISEKPLLSSVHLPEIDFEKTEKLFSKQFEHISESAERSVKEHISRCLDEKGEDWLAYGLRNIKEGKCPFCGQKIKGIEIIESYRMYFSEEYVGLKAEIVGLNEEINETLSQEAILKLQEIISSNNSLVEFWKEYVDTEFPTIEFEKVKVIWNALKKELDNHFARKKAAPLEAPLSEELKDLIRTYNQKKKEFEEFNTIIEGLNKLIGEEKGKVEEANFAREQEGLQKLINVKIRYSEETEKICKDYQELQSEKSKLETNKTDARGKLEDYTEAVLRQYEAKINESLQKFGADFQIVEVNEGYHGGKPSLNYCIKIKNIPVELRSPNDDQPIPCFKNTLSSGDKSSLAFAFFLAQLDQDPNLANKIVVLDDPISSLDCHRRICTQQQIGRLCSLAKQVIVMSHDPYFLRLVWQQSTDKPNLKTLHIFRSGENSVISEWDIERETQGEYFQNYFCLIDYLEHGQNVRDLHAVARCIRPLLEANLRMRFPRQFPRGDWLGDMIGRIRGSGTGDALNRLQPLLGELTEINDYSKNYHHDQNPAADICPITDGELKTFVNRTLDVISGVLAGRTT